MYVFVKAIDFVSFYEFVYDYGIVPIVWYLCYPLANEVAKGYSNATVRPSVLPSVRLSVTSL